MEGSNPTEDFLNPNTQPVTSPWELITSKCKCVKRGIQKRGEVVHLFINTSAEVGLDAFRPHGGSDLSKTIIGSSSVRTVGVKSES